MRTESKPRAVSGKRTETLTVRLTEDEKASIQSIADRMGVTLTEIVLTTAGVEPPAYQVVKARLVAGPFPIQPEGWNALCLGVAKITHGKRRGDHVVFDYSNIHITRDDLSLDGPSSPMWVEIDGYCYPCIVSSE